MSLMNDNKYDLVVRNNKLVEAFITMTRNEYKLTLYLISKIKKNDVDFVRQEVTLKELSELLSVGTNGLSGDLKKFEKSLVSNNIQFELDDGRRKTISWFSYTEYIPNEAILIVKFNDILKPLLLNIKNNYTKLFLDQIIRLNSKHSMRVYEILKQYEKIGERTIGFEDLKGMLGVDKKYTYFNFKKRVLLKAQEDLKKYSDIYFEFEEIKIGKKVVAIKFIIKQNNKKLCVIDNQMELKDTENEIEKNETKKIISDFHSKYNGTLDYLLIKNLVKMKGIDCVKKCIQEFVNFVGNANKVENTFYDFTKKYGTEKAYTKPTTFHNLKPIQATNYDQREYDDNFFNSLYDNVTFTKR